MDDSLLAEWLTTPLVGDVTAAQVGMAAAVALISYLAITLALRFAHARASARAKHNGTAAAMLEDVLGGTRHWLIGLAAALVGVGLLDLPTRWHDRVSQLWFVVLVLQVALWANRAATIGVRRYIDRHASAGMTQVSASATLLSWAMHTLLWTVVLLAMLSNVGVNITAFVASLGVGGIAIALAVQNVLGDLFASLAIAVDKPFEVGDFIVVNGIAGSVEHVGLKSTRIRSIGGEQIVASNTDLLKQNVSNYKRMETRRIVFNFGVSYATTPDQAGAIPGIVKAIVASSDKLKFDRAHLKGFGESSLDYEVVYTVQVSDYNLYMDLQQMINLELMRQLADIGVEFAFPTRTVHVVDERRQDADAVLPSRSSASATTMPRARPEPPRIVVPRTA